MNAGKHSPAGPPAKDPSPADPVAPGNGASGPDPRPAGSRRAVFAVVLVFISLVVLLEGLVLALDYRAAIREKREHLRSIVQSQASLIKAVSRFDQEHSPDYPGGAFEATLSQLREARSSFRETGEFTIARVIEGQIVFLLRHQLIDLAIPDPVPMSSSLAEPMRRALSGESGTLVGLDYRGVMVLAAFEPISELGVGLVAKTDLVEVRAPFFRAGFQAAAVGLFLILIGTLVISRIGNRLVATIQTARDRAETYLENAGSLFVILDSEGCVRQVNSRTCVVLGFPREAIVGKNWFENFLPHDSSSRVSEVHRSFLSTDDGGAEYFENEIITKDGRKRLILWHNTSLEDGSTGEILSLSSGEDITETRTAQEEIARAEEEAISFGQMMENSVAEIYLFEAESFRFLSVNRGARHNLGYSLSELRQMTPLDIKPSLTKEHFGELLEPLRTGAEASVTFESSHRRKDESFYPVAVRVELYSEQDPPVFVAQVRDLTQQRVAEKETVERESRFQAAAESLSDALVIADSEGIIDFWNATAERMFGWTSEEAVGRSVEMLVPPEVRKSHQEGMKAAAERGHLAAHGKPMTLRALREDGTEFPATVTMSTWASDGKRHFSAVIQDVTDAERALELMRQAERARTAAAGLSRVLVGADTESGFLEDVAKLVIETGGYRLCWIGYREEDEAKTVRPIAHGGVGNGYVDSLQISWAADDRGHGPTGTAIRTGKTSIAQDIPSNPEFAPWRSTAETHGFASSIAVPLRVDGVVVGALNVYASEADAFQKEEVAILETMAASVGLGVASIRGVEKRREVEGELHKLSQAVEEASVSIVITDVDGHYEYVNPKFTELTGWTLDEVRGKTPRILKSGGTSDETYRELWETIQAGAVWRGEFFNTGKGGRTFWASATISPVFNSGSKITHFVGIEEDITARKAAELELERERHSLAQRVEERTAELSAAYAQLEGASRAKDEFLASMSHELRTPLNTILTLSESMEEGVYGELSTDQMGPLKTVMSSGNHLLSLINDLLDLSKIGAGKLEVGLTPVRIEDVCEASLRMVRELAHKKQLRISTSFDLKAEFVLADERRLRQVLVNLLGNAVKFTDPGGEMGLDLAVDAEAQQVEFAVWDTGIGLSEDQIGNLFQPFTQMEAGLDRRFEGTGLGLSLVAKLIELQGGSVSVESEGPGKGSRFSVVLPLAGEPERKPETSATDAEGEESETLPPDAPRILIVDDNENTLATLSRYFGSKAFRVSLARNGEEAVERAIELQPDIILMDVQMPKMDGLEATRRIRAVDELAGTPIIAVTALAMPGDREKCFDAGVDDYMPKPVRLKALLERVTEFTRLPG